MARKYVDYAIWQIKQGEQYRGVRFFQYDEAIKVKSDLNLSDYEQVYDELGVWHEDENSGKALEDIYKIYQYSLPADYKGHSISVSDVIQLDNEFYYVEPTGFKKLDEHFLDPLSLAKLYINNFCEGEYGAGNTADFSHLERVSIAYTTLTDYELDINAYANLVNYQLYQEFDGEIITLGKYDSLSEMNEKCLSALDFSDLTFVDFAIQDKHAEKEKKERAERRDALAELNFSTDKYELPFIKGADLITHSVEFQDKSLEYLGGIDENGHERKDNYGIQERSLSLTAYVSGHISVYTSGTGEWYDNEHQLIDPTNSEQVNGLKIMLDRFIDKSTDLAVFVDSVNRSGEMTLVNDNDIIKKESSIHSENEYECSQSGLFKALEDNYNSFIDVMENGTVKNAIDHSYEITWKKDIFYYVENSDLELSQKQIRALLTSENPLDEIYLTISNSEVYNSFSDIEDAIRYTANKISGSYLREHGENSLTMLSAEWIARENAYRLYDPENVHITIAYDNGSISEMQERVKEKGYAGLSVPEEGIEQSAELRNSIPVISKNKSL